MRLFLLPIESDGISLLLGFKSAAASRPKNQKILKGKLICQGSEKVRQGVELRSESSKL
jgi:hypothetical protein